MTAEQQPKLECGQYQINRVWGRGRQVEICADRCALRVFDALSYHVQLLVKITNADGVLPPIYASVGRLLLLCSVGQGITALLPGWAPIGFDVIYPPIYVPPGEEIEEAVRIETARICGNTWDATWKALRDHCGTVEVERDRLREENAELRRRLVESKALSGKAGTGQAAGPQGEGKTHDA